MRMVVVINPLVPRTPFQYFRYIGSMGREFEYTMSEAAVYIFVTNKRLLRQHYLALCLFDGFKQTLRLNGTYVVQHLLYL